MTKSTSPNVLPSQTTGGGIVRGLVTPNPSPVQRSAALMQQARQMANEALTDAIDQMIALSSAAGELKDLDTLSPGIQEHLRGLEKDLVDRIQGVCSIKDRRL